MLHSNPQKKDFHVASFYDGLLREQRALLCEFSRFKNWRTPMAQAPISEVPSSKKRNNDQQSKNIKRAEGTKKKASKNGEPEVPPTTEQLCEIWVKITSDPRARRALKRLDQAGFRISHMKPMDATFNDHPCWADYIAALP